MTLPFVDVAVKVTILIGIAALVLAFAGRRASAATRHLVWTLVIAATLILPALIVLVPAWTIVIPTAAAATPATWSLPRDTARPLVAVVSAEDNTADALVNRPAPVSSATPKAEASLSMSWPAMLAGLYALGLLVVAARAIGERLALRRFAARSRLVDDPQWLALLEQSARCLSIGRPVRLLEAAGDVVPMVFGIRRPAIVIPAAAAAWCAERRHAVLLHELAHVARHDCLTQMLGVAACAMYWPHPGVWWTARRLRVERELACDDRVIAAGADARDYAGDLLDIARSLGSSPAPALGLGMARSRQVEGRLLALLDDGTNRSVLTRRARMVLAAAGLIGVSTLAALRAQTGPAPSGTWEVRPSGSAGIVNLEVRTGRSSSVRLIALSKLEGLTPTELSAGGPVRFMRRTDPGTFAFEGSCRGGRCGGTFTFAASGTFPQELANRAVVGRASAEDQYALALSDFELATVDQLKTDGYTPLTAPALVRAAQHGIDLDYARGMSQLGYKLGAIEALIVLRDHGVDPTYVRDLGALELSKLSAEELRHARDHGVDPEYVRGMQAQGHRNLTVDQLVAARDHGVDPEFVRGMTAELRRLTLDELRMARDHGIDPHYVTGMSALGYPGLPLDRLRAARDHGVDPEFVRGLQSLGYRDLSVDDLIQARNHGIDPEYVRGLAALGYKDVGLASLIRMRDRGVDPAYVRHLKERGIEGLSVDELIQRRDRGDGSSSQHPFLDWVAQLVARWRR